MTGFLLDTNLLIALIDPAHVQHNRAHGWFAASSQRLWATCPLTENDVVRIVGSARYPNSPGTPGAVAELLSVLCALPGHEFWHDDITLLDAERVSSKRLLDSSQVTGTHLLALARARGGKLVTFDQRLVAVAAVGGAQALHVIR